MSKTVSIATLCKHVDQAKERLSDEKAAILDVFALPEDFCREEYAFAYMRAERLGMKAINETLAEVDWLPMQLDTSSEIITDGRLALTRWLKSPDTKRPGSDEFGNDFMHALTRAGFLRGWETSEFEELSDRVAVLFRDLSCLISIIYYSTWLAEHGVGEVRLHNPDDLIATAEDIDSLLQSPELYSLMRAHEQDEGKSEKGKEKAKAAKKTLPAPKKQTRPILHVIAEHGIINPFTPDPATV